MRLQTINTGFFKLDGGAMFGVVPKTIWQKLNPPDDNNMCTWAMRCLLVEDGNRLILIDCGIGEKQSEKFFGYYHLHGNDSLATSLHTAGVNFSDITDVVLTHLHFDHCGGAVKWNSFKDGYECTFPKAKYWSMEKHWNHAMDSNPREKPSFLVENFMPIKESGQLYFADNLNISENISLLPVDGHTVGMMLPVIKSADKTLVYCADLIPSMGHLPVNYVMAYDIEPLKSMDERGRFMETAVAEKYVLFMEHDRINECCTITKNERGTFVAENVFDLNTLFK